ncbi:MAG TPA: glycosyltransferase family 4 protein [Candidatus Magasanikbacteria bacterium]|jgi:glycosyltransferase involved in cell wall biosynthesis|nr:glycosyltransferase family 4 protein [Candidatus Magasanikbacteria bacterium]HQF57143.1 glycosyltransferase family 4 protein [Candidatus Magasanikbacteria bacterium]HQL52918.1 glycosyltransferase family 4 protein [Candidatus Magasanikbacteria bacterium]
MRIAMIGQKGIPAIQGGIERHVHDLSLGLVEKGQDVTVYARKWYTPEEKKSFAGIKIKHLPSIRTKHLDAISHTFFATLHAIKNNFDVIHYHGVGPSLLAWIPRIFAPRTLVITTFHCIDRYHQKWNPLAKLILHLGEKTACFFPHKTIVISQGLQKYCLEKYNKETIYIPNGINPIEETDSDKITQFGLKKDEYLVMISRLIPHKGAHILIEAFNNLKKNNPENKTIQNLKLAIVGGSAFTDDYVRQLHELASSNNQIIFTDFQSGKTVDQLYANSLALVHPSLNEGLPITVIQAMSHGKPVLLTDIAEHLELNTNDNLIFKENDVQDLEEKMLYFINLNDEEKKSFGIENKQIIEENYLWKNLIPKVIEVYQRKTRESQPKKLLTENI